MDFLAVLKSIDESLFLLINSAPHSYLLDQVFLFFSFYPLIIWTLIGLIVVVIEERKEKLFIVRLVLALLLAGSLASGFIKPIIKRPRPDISFKEKAIIISEKPAIFPWNNDFAFPSGHAAVAFAGAYVVTRQVSTGKHGKKHSARRNIVARSVFITFAVLTAFSRIYLGKHFPLDVIVGGILGWLIGMVTWKLVDIFLLPLYTKIN